MKRIIAGISALAIAAAMAPMAAYARGGETKTLDKDKKSDTTTATYNVDATYTVTIPAAAVIADDAESADAQQIKAENVVLEEGQKIAVTLSGASNTTGTGTVFNAMTGKSGDANRSTVKYNIKKTKDEKGDDTVITNIALNGKVAEFTGNQSVELKFIKDNSDDNKPTAAGAHTEQLTFSIAVEDAVSTPTIADAFVNGSTTTIIIHNAWGNNTITFTNNNGTYNIGSKSLNPDGLLDSVSVTPNGDKLVIRVYSSYDQDSFSVTLDKSDNSYSVWDSDYYEADSVTSLVINETEIIDTVSKK